MGSDQSKPLTGGHYVYRFVDGAAMCDFCGNRVPGVPLIGETWREAIERIGREELDAEK